jgi:hypothetical protein
MTKELQLLKSLGLEAKEAARIVYSGNENLERYLIKNNKYLSKALPDLKTLKKTTVTLTKATKDAKDLATKASEAAKKTKELLDKTQKTVAETKKIVSATKKFAEETKKIVDGVKKVTDLFQKTLGKKVPGGIGAGANMLASLATAGITVLAVKTSEELLDIRIRELDRDSAQLSLLFYKSEKNYRYIQRVETRVDGLSAGYDVLASYQGNLTQRLNKNEHDFLFLKQETTQQLNALSEVIRVSNINSYNNDLKLQNQILELAEKIKGIKAGTPGNNLILDLVNAKLALVNESIAKNERLNQAERDSIKKEIKSLNDKIPSNNNNQSNNNSFNPSQLWQAINTNKAYTTNSLNNSKEALNQLKSLKVSDSKQEKRLQFLEKDVPKKFEARRQFEAQTEAQFKEQKKTNENQDKDISNVKTEIGNVKADISNVKESNELVATSVKIVDGKIESVKYTKLDKADYDNGIKIVDGKIEPLKKTTQKNESDLNTLAGGFTALGSGMVKLQQDLNNLKNKPIKLSPQNFPDLDLLKKDIENFKKENDNFKKETEKVNKEGNDLIKNILPTLLPILHLIPAKTADGLKPSIPTIPQIENAAATGTCKTLQPNGCMRTNLDNLENNIKTNDTNNSNGLWNKVNGGLNGLNLGANAAQMNLLNQIDSKLGPQVTGGISGFLDNFLKKFNDLAKWMHLDRVLNILIWWQTLHNASMLSQNIASTLGQGIDNLITLFGLKDSEGKPFSISSILGKAYVDFAKAALGEETYKNLNATWNKYNRIYQAATNMLNSLQSIYYSIFGALNTIGSWNAKVGNALKKWGAVSEKAYEWFNPTPNFNNKFFNALEAGQQVADAFEQITSEGVSIQQNIKEMGEQKTELDKALSQGDGSKQANSTPEAKKVKDDEDNAKNASKSPLISDADKIKPE